MAFYTHSSQVMSYALSGNAYTDGLLSDSASFRYIWSAQSGGKTSITYSLPFTSLSTALFESNYGSEPDGTTVYGLDATQKSTLELAFARWEEVANLDFSEVAETDDGIVGDIRVAFSSDVAPWWGWAKLSGGGYSNAHGDIWINPEMNDDDWDAGSYSLSALVHEIGHALGLDHPFEGNIIPDGYDNRRYTIMSYTDPEEYYWWNETAGKYDYLITGPMVYDIRAIQYLYGANMAFHAGNDTYNFASDVPFFKAIWDAGGTDTFDVSGFTKSCIINLQPGSYSTLGFDDLGLVDSLGIAFDCWIENATGGSGNDTLSGNALANTLRGNNGSDRLLGLAGADTLVGGAGADRLNGGSGLDILTGGSGNDILAGGDGSDTARFADATAGITADLVAGTASATAGGDAAAIGADTLTSIENLSGSSYADSLSGNADANRLWGMGGDDTLSGLGGADTLDGANGKDQLSGGAGNDILFGGLGDDLLDGGAGRDEARYDAAVAAIIVNLSTGKAFSFATADAARIGSDTLLSVEDITATAYADRLTGNESANRLYGKAGDDILSGVGGSDILNGGNGNDVLTGGAGRDVMTGGTGADRFVSDDADFSGLTTSTADRITDFRHAEGDRISLSLVDANIANGAADDAFAFIGAAAFSNKAGQLRYQQINGNTYVQGDTNGDAAADFWLRLDGAISPVAGDFIL